MRATARQHHNGRYGRLAAGLGDDTSQPHLWVIFSFNSKSANDVTYTREHDYNHSATDDSNTTTDDSSNAKWILAQGEYQHGRGAEEQPPGGCDNEGMGTTQPMQGTTRQGTAPARRGLTYPHSLVFLHQNFILFCWVAHPLAWNMSRGLV